MSYELIIFDWDGTLMDSTRVIAESLQAACRDAGIAVPAESEARFVIGLGLADTFRHVAPGLDDDRWRHGIGGDIGGVDDGQTASCRKPDASVGGSRCAWLETSGAHG